LCKKILIRILGPLGPWPPPRIAGSAGSLFTPLSHRRYTT